MTSIFLSERTFQPFFENVCIYPGLKYKTLNFARHLSADFFIACFFHNLGVRSNLSDNILSVVSFTLNKQNNKWPPKLHLFYIFVEHYRSIFGFNMT